MLLAHAHLYYVDGTLLAIPWRVATGAVKQEQYRSKTRLDRGFSCSCDRTPLSSWHASQYNHVMLSGLGRGFEGRAMLLCNLGTTGTLPEGVAEKRLRGSPLALALEGNKDVCTDCGSKRVFVLLVFTTSRWFQGHRRIR